MGHFANKDSKYHHIVFRLREIISKYTSENMAGVLIDLFRDYRIINNIRYFMANNAELNNIYINVIFYILYLNILIKLRKRH